MLTGARATPQLAAAQGRLIQHKLHPICLFSRLQPTKQPTLWKSTSSLLTRKATCAGTIDVSTCTSVPTEGAMDHTLVQSVWAKSGYKKAASLSGTPSLPNLTEARSHHRSAENRRLSSSSSLFTYSLKHHYYITLMELNS